MSSNIFEKQIKNRNFLTPIGFKFILNRSPKVAFFSNSADIPGMTLGIANQPSYLKDIPLPGDKIEFDDFNLRFLVDEDLENYLEIQHWIRGIGFPESLNEIYKFQNENKNMEYQNKSYINLYSDATLQVLTSNQNPNFKIKFRDMFPYTLSPLRFDATDSDVEYFTAEVSFKYSLYEITDLNDNVL